MANAKVVTLPVPRHTFKAVVIDEAKVLATYDHYRVYVASCIRMLQMSPSEMKKTLAALEAEDSTATEQMIQECRECAENFATLSDFFESAAARMTIVDRRLI